MDEGRPHSSHWGAFVVGRGPGDRLDVRPHPADPQPSALLQSVADSVAPAVRVRRPAVRRGWLEDGPKATGRRGREPFVEVEWDVALELVAGELRRVRADHGADSIYAGSYGWASAGRFHHAQSQLRRFFNLLGGATTSRNSYSAAAAEVLLPHVLGSEQQVVGDSLVTWKGIAADADLVVAFGGMPRRNQAVGPGGASRHGASAALETALARGAGIVNVSPIRDDLDGAEWLAIRPATDVALMLALAHTLLVEDRHDAAFLARHTIGFDALAAYLTGREDGVRKSADWAAPLCGVEAERIAALARRMSAGRTVISVAGALQRAEHGEQPVWMGLALAAMLGRMEPGAGFAFFLGGMANWGRPPLAVPLPRIPAGADPLEDAWIPVGRVADMLLAPGSGCHYDGRWVEYPDVHLVYWCGGNPFHHHQDLNRLRRAWERPETVIVHEPYWTATARHADIVLPATITLERDDLGAAANDPLLIAMHAVVAPHGQARDDYAIFAALAARLGVGERFTEGRDAWVWVAVLYEQLGARMATVGRAAPPFEAFWAAGELELPTRPSGDWLRRFVIDPERAPLATPSGRIELGCRAIAAMGYADCPGHPAWLPKQQWHGAADARRHPLMLVANQPRTRLHGQLDFATVSRRSKVAGREPIRIHPADAVARGIADGDVVRVHNDRGACLAGAILSEAIRPGVVQLSTGAWYDPDDALGVCRHGNPNVVTRDAGTSALAQGSTGQLTLVDIERWTGPTAPPSTDEPPPLEAPSDRVDSRSGRPD